MHNRYKEVILKATGASNVYEQENIQSLWSGYGSIIRYGLQGSQEKSVVVKHVQLKKGGKHPRGWNTSLSHLRKKKSYKVEAQWYKNFGQFCDTSCKIPTCLAVDYTTDETFMVLEDLDASGYNIRKNYVNTDEINTCLKWLANFHAVYLGVSPHGLWENGTYWHLETRPDELDNLEDIPLKKAAKAIDEKLSRSPFQTIVHGDAKLANFCFSADGKQVAAVDFQYVGGGCGMKDVAYFLGSCLSEEACEGMVDQLLGYYFNELAQAIEIRQKEVDIASLISNWRELFPFAWADFHRFIKGWSPGHWKVNTYSEKLARKVVNELLK